MRVTLHTEGKSRGSPIAVWQWGFALRRAGEGSFYEQQQAIQIIRIRSRKKKNRPMIHHQLDQDVQLKSVMA